MPRIRYVTNDVPQWGVGAFSPVPIPTPLASSGGEQIRILQQWTDAQDPNVAGYASTNPGNLSFQPSYAQTNAELGGPGGQPAYTGQAPPLAGNAGGVPDATFVPGLPLAFRPVVNARHFMAYVASNKYMGPTGPNTHMKIWSDNPLPIPAQNPGRVARPAMRTQPAGTPIATAWPRPFITWPTWGKSRQA